MHDHSRGFQFVCSNGLFYPEQYVISRTSPIITQVMIQRNLRNIASSQ